MGGSLIQHQQIPLFQGYLDSSIDHMVGAAPAHIHDLYIIMGVRWKRRKPGMRPYIDELSFSQHLLAVHDKSFSTGVQFLFNPLSSVQDFLLFRRHRLKKGHQLPIHPLTPDSSRSLSLWASPSPSASSAVHPGQTSPLSE